MEWPFARDVKDNFSAKDRSAGTPECPGVQLPLVMFCDQLTRSSSSSDPLAKPPEPTRELNNCSMSEERNPKIVGHTKTSETSVTFKKFWPKYCGQQISRHDQTCCKTKMKIWEESQTLGIFVQHSSQLTWELGVLAPWLECTVQWWLECHVCAGVARTSHMKYTAHSAFARLAFQSKVLTPWWTSKMCIKSAFEMLPNRH